MHVANAEGAQHIFSHVLLIGFAGNGFHHFAEHEVADVGIGVAGSRREIEALLHQELDEVRLCNRVGHPEGLGHMQGKANRIAVARKPRIWRGRVGNTGNVAVPAGAVLQQMLHSDVVNPLVGNCDRPQGRVIGQQAARPKHLVAEGKPAILHQLHDADGGDGLGHARNAEKVIGLGGFIAAEVGFAEGTHVNEFAVFGHGKSGTGNVVLCQKLIHQVVAGGHSWRWDSGLPLEHGKRRQATKQ